MIKYTPLSRYDLIDRDSAGCPDSDCANYWLKLFISRALYSIYARTTSAFHVIPQGRPPPDALICSARKMLAYVLSE